MIGKDPQSDTTSGTARVDRVDLGMDRQNDPEQMRLFGTPKTQDREISGGTNPTATSPANIREIWPHEARNFTPWLTNNLELISHCTGLELRELGQEVSAAGGRADIVAWDMKSKQKVIIENQLEPANTRHFQQLVSYGEYLEARIRIWIASSFSKKFHRLISEENKKGQLKQNGFIYYLVRINLENWDDGRECFSLEVAPTKTQIDRILLTDEEQSNQKRLVDEFWAQWKIKKTRSVKLPGADSILITKAVDMQEAKIDIHVWCAKGVWRNDRIRKVKLYIRKLQQKFPEYNIDSEWSYNDVHKIVLQISSPINLDDLDNWKEIREWFMQKEDRIISTTNERTSTIECKLQIRTANLEQNSQARSRTRSTSEARDETERTEWKWIDEVVGPAIMIVLIVAFLIGLELFLRSL